MPRGCCSCSRSTSTGKFVGGPWAGEFVKQADRGIIRDLRERGLLWRDEQIRHTYPFCWRCDTPVLYYAKPSWYIRTTAVQDRLIEGNQRIHWVPGHIKDGRFGEWLEGNIDWAVSRERYWGTPLPFWVCEACQRVDCIGSYAELRERSGAEQEIEDPHRPYIDAVTLACPECGGTMRRIPEVADAWFDSGAMPYAQWHMPFEREATFNERFPADFICEAVDQTRGWFYTLHALATLLNRAEAVPESIAYKNVICLGLILDGQGLKMSKSRGNVVDPWTVLDEHGADALRWYLYTASPPGNARRFSTELVGETARRFISTLWNTYSFFVTYANIANFDPASAPAEAEPHRARPLDPLRAAPDRAARDRRPRCVRARRRRPPDRRVRGAALELVRAPQPAALLEVGRLGRHAGGAAHPLRVPHHRLEAARPVHAVPRRRDVPQPRRRCAGARRLRWSGPLPLDGGGRGRG